MAASALTVTPPNPTPPTNLTSAGSTPPNPGTFDPTVYAQATTGDVHYPRPELAPFYDDGYTFPEPTPLAFAAKKAALAVGGTSVDHEGLGTEAVGPVPPKPADFTGPVLVTYPLRTVSSGPAQTAATLAAGPNATHPSYLSGTTVPTITGTSAGGTAGPGTALLTVTGTGYTRASVVNVNGIPQTTNYVSATSLTVTNAPKKQTAGAGNIPVTVTNGAGPTSASFNWAFT